MDFWIFFSISFRPKKGKGNNLPVAAAVALPVTPYHERGKLIYKTSFTKVNLISWQSPAQEFSHWQIFLSTLLFYFKNLIYYIIFTKALRKGLSKTTHRIRKQVGQKLRFLLQGGHHPSLRTKKIKSEKDVYELSITKNYRLTFHIEGDTYVLRKVGTDILGRWTLKWQNQQNRMKFM